jgi:hypothetical protein
MSRVFQSLRLLLAATLLAVMSARAQDATVVFKDKRSWDVEVSGLTSNGILKMRMKNSNTDAEAPVADVAGIRFAIPFDEAEVTKNYTFGEYEKVVPVLADKLKPYFYYLTIENNISPYCLMLARSQYWLGQHAEAMSSAEKLTRYTTKGGKEWTEASLVKCLCLHAQNKPRETERILQTLPKIERDDPVAAIYWYSLARLQVTTNNVREANHNIANIIAFAGKDFDWTPPALYQSAEFHLADHRFESAKQICEEIQICAQDTPWQAKAKDLIPEIARRKVEHEAKLKKAADEAAAKAARSPLRPQPNAENPIDKLLEDNEGQN